MHVRTVPRLWIRQCERTAFPHYINPMVQRLTLQLSSRIVPSTTDVSKTKGTAQLLKTALNLVSCLADGMMLDAGVRKLLYQT